MMLNEEVKENSRFVTAAKHSATVIINRVPRRSQSVPFTIWPMA